MENTIARVLVVDDDASSRWTYAKSLQLAGYHVTTADGGATGLSLLLSDPPDLALVDLRMPDVGGLEVLAEACEHRTSVPIVIFTRFDVSAAESAARQLGAADFVHAPWTPEELIALVEKHVHGFSRRDRRSNEAGYATDRWIARVMDVARAEKDIPSEKAWCAEYHVSETTLRRCCSPFKVKLAATLDLGRGLRIVVAYAGRTVNFPNVLDIQSDAAMAVFLAAAGFTHGRPVPNLATYLRTQRFVRNAELLQAVHRALEA